MNTVITEDSSTTAAGTRFLTFELSSEYYAIPTATAQEIMKVQPMTPIPHTPKYVKGVINLRGKLLTVIDLRTKLGLEEPDSTERASIIVVEYTKNETSAAVGVIVDNVNENIVINSSSIDHAANIESVIQKDWIEGVAKLDGTLITILGINTILSSQDPK